MSNGNESVVFDVNGNHCQRDSMSTYTTHEHKFYMTRRYWIANFKSSSAMSDICCLCVVTSVAQLKLYYVSFCLSFSHKTTNISIRYISYNLL